MTISQAFFGEDETMYIFECIRIYTAAWNSMSNINNVTRSE